MSDHLETYSSAKLTVLFMDDENGREIKKDTLFENLYDFWTAFHDSNESLFYWYRQKIWMLEMSIRRKWNSQFTFLILKNIWKKSFKKNISNY